MQKGYEPLTQKVMSHKYRTERHDHTTSDLAGASGDTIPTYQRTSTASIRKRRYGQEGQEGPGR